MSSLLLPFLFILGGLCRYVISLEIAPLLTDILLFIFIFCIGRDIEDMLRRNTLGMRQVGSLVLQAGCNIIGSLLGGAIIGFFLQDLSLRDGILIASSVGFYSVGGALVSAALGTKLGILCFLVNFLREGIVLLLGGIIGRIHASANVYISGAAAMDTCLATIKNTGGDRGMMLGLVSGGILTMIAPVLVNIVLYFY